MTVKQSIVDWLDILRCPADIYPLRWIETGVARSLGDSSEGKLECAACGRTYPVSGGIARFVLGNLDDERKTVEMRIRDEEAETYDHWVGSSEEITTPRQCLETMRPIPGDTVIDLGCGTGRLTLEFLPHVERVVAVDFSLASLKVLHNRVPDALRRKLLLVQADICAPPVTRKAFSQAVSFRTIQQLPTVEMRHEVFNTISSLLAIGGSLTITVDHWSLQKRLYARRGLGDYTAKEGMHSNNLYYYNFEPAELLDSVRRAGMQIELMRGIEIGLPGARFLKGLAVPIKQIASRVQLGMRLAQVLLCRTRLLPE